MKSLLKGLLGLNAIALAQLARCRPRRFGAACQQAFTAARHPRVTPPSPTNLPEITLDEILGERKPVIQLTVGEHEDGTLPRVQAMALLAILVAEGPAEVLEIGTYMGGTTRHLAENLPHATIHTVDLADDFAVPAGPVSALLPPKDDFHLIARRVVGRDFKGQPCAQRIRQHFADTADWDFRTAGHPTFFFIDGSHTYEYCKSDTERCYNLCAGHGVFLWHDCDETHPGVIKFLQEWRQQGRDVRRISGTPIAYWKSASLRPSRPTRSLRTRLRASPKPSTS
jgi:hypothetical protein